MDSTPQTSAPNESLLFTPVTIGPLTLRNRSIRSAAFEGMCQNNAPTPMLHNYHVSVARGGIGMTTLAYAAVARSGLSFSHQLWMRPEVLPALREITDDIHKAGAKASIQLGHCGNMSKHSTAGCMPVSASTGFNLYSPTFVRGLRADELPKLARNFGEAVRMARDAGFDAVEIHAGHGYLISQFLSPYTNHRHDAYGGSLENRMRFMQMCMEQVLEAAGNDLAVLVKMNMHDGFRAGMQADECLRVAAELEKLGAHALVLSAGFVSRAPMEVMRGSMPIKAMAYYMKQGWLRFFARHFGRLLIPDRPFSEGYFLDEALRFRQALHLPLIYVGGLVSRAKIEEVLHSGFQAVQMARALINEPDFINRLRQGEERCSCSHTNYCIARMYSREMACHEHCTLPPVLQRELEQARRKEERARQRS